MYREAIITTNTNYRTISNTMRDNTSETCKKTTISNSKQQKVIEPFYLTIIVCSEVSENP